MSSVLVSNDLSANLTNASDSLFMQLYYAIHQIASSESQSPEFDIASNSLKTLLSSPEVAETFIDAFSVYDLEFKTSALNAEKYERVFLPKFVLYFNGVNMRTACERLNSGLFETLLRAEVFNSPEEPAMEANFTQKLTKLRTKTFYLQTKFNLIWESNEGFSKLLNALWFSQFTRPANLCGTLQRLQGCFHLDPNRVTDLIFEMIPLLTNRETLLESVALLSIDSSTILNIMRMKISYISSNEEAEHVSDCAAILIRRNMVELSAICDHFSPSFERMSDHMVDHMNSLQAVIDDLNVVSLKEDRLEDLSNVPSSVSASVKNADKIAQQPFTFSTKPAGETGSLALPPGNQKICFYKSLIKHSMWAEILRMDSSFPKFYVFADSDVRQLICDRVYEVLGPLYDGVCDILHSPPPTLDVNFLAHLDLPLVPVICSLGPYISVNVLLLVKLVRICTEFLRKITKMEARCPLYYDIINLIDESILPALGLVQPNSGLVEEVWSLIYLLPPLIRYNLYDRWKCSSSCPELRMAYSLVTKQMQYLIRRLTKENVKMMGRKIGKISLTSPVIVMDFLLVNALRYDNLIAPIIECLKFVNGLSLDVLAYIIFDLISRSDDSVMIEDGQLSSRAIVLANFTGMLCKKYNHVDISLIFHLVVNQLSSGNIYSLPLLQEVVQKMSGIDIVDELTTEQMEALAGGTNLKQEVAFSNQARNAKKLISRLKDIVLDDNLFVSMCIQLAQLRDGILYLPNFNHLHVKLKGRLYDQCHDTLYQFTQFLDLILSPEQHHKDFASFEQLTSQYGLSHETAFMINRLSIWHEIDKADSSQGFHSCIERLMGQFDGFKYEFCSIFWMLTLYDIEFPEQLYKKQIIRIKTDLSANEASDKSKRREILKLQELLRKLQSEMEVHERHVKSVRAVICDIKIDRGSSDAMRSFFFNCIFKRLQLSAVDAVFCAKFGQILHFTPAVDFQTAIFYDKIFSSYIIYLMLIRCSENEAYRYGIFISQCLGCVMRWHGSGELFGRECANNIGFLINSPSPSSDKEQMDFPSYKRIVLKWHNQLKNAVISGIGSSDFILIRNCISLLLRVADLFPVIDVHGAAIFERVEIALQREKISQRNDLTAMLIGYLGLLKSKQKSWIPRTEFCVKPVGKSPDIGSRPSSATRSGGASVNKRRSLGGEAEDKYRSSKPPSLKRDNSECLRGNHPAVRSVKPNVSSHSIKSTQFGYDREGKRKSSDLPDFPVNKRTRSDFHDRYEGGKDRKIERTVRDSRASGK